MEENFNFQVADQCSHIQNIFVTSPEVKMVLAKGAAAKARF